MFLFYIANQLFFSLSHPSCEQNVDVEAPISKKEEETDELITDRQTFQIRQQVLAYKYLIRNMPLPPDLERSLFNLQKDQWEVEQQRIVNRSLQFYNDKVEKNEELKKLITEKMTKQTTEDQQLSTLFIEKQQYYIDKRKQEIQKFLAVDVLSREAQQKLQCELKMLSLTDFHRQMHQKIAKRIEKGTESPKSFDSVLLDRSFYRREKPQRKTQVNGKRGNNRI